MVRSNIFRKILLVSLAALQVSGAYGMFQRRSVSKIVNFSKQMHEKQIMQMIRAEQPFLGFGFGPGTKKVLMIGGRFAGFVAYEKKDKALGIIHQLGVASCFRRWGFGKRLLDCAEFSLLGQKCDRVELTTHATNKKARFFYESAGFELVLPDCCYEGFLDPSAYQENPELFDTLITYRKKLDDDKKSW